MSDKPSNTLTTARQGKPWDNDEDRCVHERFLSHETISALAELHQQSEGGISARLRRLGLIDDEGNKVEPPPAFEARTPRRAARQEGASSAVRWTFAASLNDGTRLELKSNRPITSAMIEQLAKMIGEGT